MKWRKNVSCAPFVAWNSWTLILSTSEYLRYPSYPNENPERFGDKDDL